MPERKESTTATFVTHGFVAIVIGKLFVGQREIPARRFWILAVVCANLPDADLVGFYLGIAYGDLWGHRGISHSLFFASLVGLLIVSIGFRKVPLCSKKWWALLSFYFLVTVSHGVLDAMTDGGLGVAFFAPFDATRYFLPWRPIKAASLTINKLLSPSLFWVALREFLFIWIPGFVCLLAFRYTSQRNRKK